MENKRTFVEFKNNGNYLEIKCNDGFYRILFYDDKIAETSFIPNGEEFEHNSEAVILKQDLPELAIIELENEIKYATRNLKIVIEKEPFQIHYYFKNKKLISEKRGFSQEAHFFNISLELDSTEILYGTGERALGMNRRGRNLKLYNRAHYGYETHAEQMSYCIPLVLSSKMYAVHFDNYPIGLLDLDSERNNVLSYKSISGRKTYQIIASDNWLDLVSKFTDLTGKQPMLPLWALGNFSSRYGYHTQTQTERVVQKFKENQIPLDAVIIDLYWFGRDYFGNMGNLSFEKSTFPHPEQMIQSFKNQNIKTILVTEPFILTSSKRWNEAVENDILSKNKDGENYVFDLYFGRAGLIDLFKPEAQKWFWNIYKELRQMGIEGVWGDLGEPEAHPSDLIHACGTANKVHNIYGHQWAKMIFEGYKKDFPKERPFILMRSGYAGTQRYGIIPWSGDVNRTWGGLQSQPEISLQMGMQGVAYMHSDLGGFAGDYYDDELYLRWLQYGVFQPVFRPHAQEEVPSEPVYREKRTMEAAKKIIELRYKLLPYNYTLVFENNQKGFPLMRPIFFEESDNKDIFNRSNEYLWGNDFLVSPVLFEGITEQEVYFPKTANWFDFYTGKKHEGGNLKTIKLNENYIPTFVRGGAFIPMINVFQSTKEANIHEFFLHFYFDASRKNSSGKLYYDDGKTMQAYENGEYELIKFKSETKTSELKIEIDNEIGTKYHPWSKKINLIVHSLLVKPKKIFVDDIDHSFHFDEEKKLLSITFDYTKLKKEIKIIL